MKGLIVFAVLMFAANTVSAQDLRSDRPLWRSGAGADELSPKHFNETTPDGDWSTGCSSPIWFGVYGDGADRFVRLDNYGVFHCAYLYGESFDATTAANAFDGHAWLAPLGVGERDGAPIEMYALQIGLSGPQYVLLGRATSLSQSSKSLELLDWRCPRQFERRRSELDIWIQDDCMVETQSDVRRLAREALNRPPQARLTLVEPEGAAPASDPIE